MVYESFIVRCTGSTGIMLLNEIALGKEHEITKDDPSLRKAPQGFDCVVAKGRTEPGKPHLLNDAVQLLCYTLDPKEDVTLKMDSKDVVVPQGKPMPVSKYNQSYFSQVLCYRYYKLHPLTTPLLIE